MTDRDLAFHEEVLHRTEAVAALTLRGKAILRGLHCDSVLTQSCHVGVLLLMPPIVVHKATLLVVNVSVTTRSISMIVYILDRGSTLFRVAIRGVRRLTELSELCVASLGRLVHLCVATVIETDVGITT